MNTLLNTSNSTVADFTGIAFTQRPASGVTRTRILYVDDDAGLRGLGQQVLVRYGYAVDTATNGVEGLASLRQTHYDLLITDQNMPKLTGLGLLAQAHQAGIDLPVVITSGETDLKKLAAQQHTEIAAILPKPFMASELLEIVARVLHEATDHRALRSTPFFAEKNRADLVNYYQSGGINE